MICTDRDRYVNTLSTIKKEEKQQQPKTTEPTWALESLRKIVGLEEMSRRNNLRVLGIKEAPRIMGRV